MRRLRTLILLTVFGVSGIGFAIFLRAPKDAEGGVVEKHADLKPSNKKQRIIPFSAELEKSRALLSPSKVRKKDGGIAAGVVESLSLSKDEDRRLSGLMDELNISISKLARKNLTIDEERSDAESGTTAYKISAFRDEGLREFGKFKDEVQMLLGASRTAGFFKLFPPHLYYGNMGANDMHFVFKEVDVGDDTAVGLHYNEVNPLTGKAELIRESEFKLVAEYLPDVFDIQYQ